MDGRVVVVTGASSGIGAATALEFAKNDFKVVLAARNRQKLESLSIEIRAQGGQALAIPVDIRQYEAIREMIASTIQQWGRIDLLFNNAGIGRINWLENLDPYTDIEELLRVNLLGTIWASHAVLPQMIAQRSGHIINMSSMSGLVGTPTYTIYAASKFGIRGFSQALRREVKAWGIHVTAVFPGGVLTDFSKKSGVRTTRRSGVSTPRIFKLSPKDVARAIVRLARKPKSIVVLPWMMRYSIWANNLVPSLVDYIATERFVKRERDVTIKKPPV